MNGKIIQWYQRLKQWHNSLKPWQKVVSPLFWVIVFGFLICIFIGFPYFTFFKTGIYKEPDFWVAAIIETAFAILISMVVFKRKKMNTGLKLILVLAPMFIPWLAARIFLKVPYLYGSWAYIYVIGIMAFLIPKPPVNFSESVNEISMKPSFFLVILPTYIPQGYIEDDISDYKRKNISIVELIYTHTQSSNVIWLIEANEPIPNLEPRNNMFKSDLEIKGVIIHLEQELTRKIKKPKSLNTPQFLELNWERGGLHFNLRADGLTYETVERIISSMIA